MYRNLVSSLEERLFIWDLQTGVIVNNIGLRCSGELFSGNLGTFTLLGNHSSFTLFEEYGTFCTHNTLDGVQLCQDRIMPLHMYELGAHWIREDILTIATSSETNGVYVVEIRELRPTSTPPLHLLASFPVPPHESGFSFSPVSYHASFVIRTEVVVFNVRNSKPLLRTKGARTNLSPPGRFSPDGYFFACGMSEREIHVWQSTPTGYVPWSNLRSRLPFEGFSFSPISPSILTWGPEGIQLLYPHNLLSLPSPDNDGPNYQRRHHLVAYSADYSHIATVRQEDGTITVLDSLSGTLRRSINTSMRIREIGVVGDTIFVADESVLARWDLKTGGRVHGTGMELKVEEDGGFGNDSCRIPEKDWSWVQLFSRGGRIWSGPGEWALDPRGTKRLWLPPSWRAKFWDHARWNGDFLALLDGRHEFPIIIEFGP